MPIDRRSDQRFADLLVGSFERLTGRPLLDAAGGERPTIDWLYGEAPFCLLAHDAGADPCFIFANRAAQRRFEYDWEAFTALPSRLSAEPVARADRQGALDSVARQGFVSDYRGVRVARSGRRFLISGATVWTLRDEHGSGHGQAAVFRHCRDLA